MKSIFRSMCVVALALTTVFTMSSFTSLDEDDIDVKQILKEAVEEQNAECPQELGEGMTLDGVYLKNSRMIYQIGAPAEIVEGFDLMKSMDEAGTTKMMLEAMLSGGDEVVFLFLMCAEVDYGIEFIFASKDGQSVNLYLSDDALEDILAEKYTEEELETIVINLLTSYM
ncbi:MAG: hypothetical protein IJB39_06885 [Alistipes sp.]|nr:hypothetical protein [Alistipes sp.]